MVLWSGPIRNHTTPCAKTEHTTSAILHALHHQYTNLHFSNIVLTPEKMVHPDYLHPYTVNNTNKNQPIVASYLFLAVLADHSILFYATLRHVPTVVLHLPLDDRPQCGANESAILLYQQGAVVHLPYRQLEMALPNTVGVRITNLSI